MSPPRVSVLMPVYNAAGTLPETLQSTAAQSLGDFEVIAVDDGSDDDSGKILEAWSRGDRRIKPIRAGRVGLVNALNHGLSRCRGEWVARMDADDRMHPDRLARQVELLDARPDISVAGSLVEIFADRTAGEGSVGEGSVGEGSVGEGSVGEGMRVYEAWLNSLVAPEDIAREIFIESPIAHPSAMVRRGELVELGGYRDLGWPEDYDLWLRYHAAGATVRQGPASPALLAGARGTIDADRRPVLGGELPSRQGALPGRRPADGPGRIDRLGRGADRAQAVEAPGPHGTTGRRLRGHFSPEDRRQDARRPGDRSR